MSINSICISHLMRVSVDGGHSLIPAVCFTIRNALGYFSGPYLCNQWRFFHQIWCIVGGYKRYYANLISRSHVKGQRSRDLNESLFGPYLCNQWRFFRQIWCIGERYKQYYANLISRSHVKGQRSCDWNEILFGPYLCNQWRFFRQIWSIGED